MVHHLSDIIYSVTHTKDGMQSLITLAKGDMRKALNILQVSNDDRMMIGVFIEVESVCHLGVLLWSWFGLSNTVPL